VLSFSAVSTYRECPRQYWFRYAGRIPAPPTIEGQFGSVLHRTLMRAGQLLQDGEVVGPERLESLYQQAWSELELVEPRRRPALEAVGQAQLAGYVAAGGLTRRPAMVERSFTTDLDGWVLHGIIDRIDPPPPPSQRDGVVGLAESSTEAVGEGAVRAEAGAGGPEAQSNGVADEAARPWRLVDYKTGTPLPRSRLRRDLQLALYALGARQALGLEPLELEIVYLKTGKHILLPADDALLGEARRIGAEVAAGIAASDFQPRPERRRCRLCPYALACDAAL
jgi:RecB family exonuclease